MIDSEYINPLTVKLDKVEEMQSRMQGINQAIQNLKHLDEWNTSASAGTVSVASNPYIYTTTTGTSPPWQILPNDQHAMKVAKGGQLDMQGEGADIRINGKSMKAWMEQVEQRLNILTPNPELEKEWDELRRLGERYRKLEKRCQEKADMWQALKKLPRPKP